MIQHVDTMGQFIANEAHQKLALLKTRTFCLQAGFDLVDSSKITTAASELTRNVLKYAGTGQLQLVLYAQQGKTGIQMRVSDRGPGISNIQGAMADNYSSGGSLGLGLPGVERLMDYFCLESEPGKGTTVTVRKYL